MSSNNLKSDLEGLENLLSNLENIDGSKIVFGVTEESDQEYPDNDINTASVGAIHEYGWGDQTEKAWLRRASSKGESREIIKKALPEAERFIKEGVKTDKADTEPLLETIRFNAEKRAKDSIRQDELIDTGLLIKTVVGEIKED